MIRVPIGAHSERALEVIRCDINPELAERSRDVENEKLQWVNYPYASFSNAATFF
jgi:hypothetical protein